MDQVKRYEHLQLSSSFFFSLEGFDSGGRGSSIGFGGDGDAMFLRGLECNHS